MFQKMTIGLAFLLFAQHASAQSGIEVAAGATVIQVKGVVCSFCAQGVERALGKLDGLDRDRYEDGVLVDIENQRISLAFASGVAVPFAEIYEGIRDGGYEPVRFHVRVSGKASRAGDGWQVESSGNQQVFELAGDPGEVKEGSVLDVQATIAADRVAELSPDARVPAALEKVFVAESS